MNLILSLQSEEKEIESHHIQEMTKAPKPGTLCGPQAKPSKGLIGFALDQTGLSAPDQGPGYGHEPSDVHTHAKKVGWRKLIKIKRKLLVFRIEKCGN